MPLHPGIPIAEDTAGMAAPGARRPAVVPPPSSGPRDPHDWISIQHNEMLGISPRATMQGQPVPLAWWQRRAKSYPYTAPQTIPQPVPAWLQSRPYSRGAGAFSPKFGQVAYNPIGGGVVAPYRIPTISGPGARYEWAAIWFDVQSIPTTMQINPTIPIETVNALIATSHVSGMYITTG